MTDVTYAVFAYQIHPDGCRSSQAHALRQSDALTGGPIGGSLGGNPVMLQFTRPLYSCVWSVRFFLWGRKLRTDS